MKNKIFSLLLTLFLFWGAVGCSAGTAATEEKGNENKNPEDIEEAVADIRLETIFNGSEIDLCAPELRTFLDEQDEIKQCSFLLEHEGKNYDYQEPEFFWSGEKDESFAVYFSETRDFSDAREIITDRNYFRADILQPNKTYYWKVRGMDSGLSSEIDCFDTKDAPSRILSVDGLKNVRDAGGWRTDSGKSVRYGMIYRGSQMNGYNQGARLTERGRDTMIRDLKIKSEVDLRRPDRDDGGQTECAIDGSYPYLKAPFDPYTCIFPQFKTSERGYDLRVPQSFQQIFEFLADRKNYPVYLHCNAGADRTGTILFLLNGLLGVSYEDLTKDFEITSFSVMGKRWRADLNGNIPVEEGVMQDDEHNYVAWEKMYGMMMQYYQTESGKLSDAISEYLVQVCNVSVETQEAVKDILLS